MLVGAIGLGLCPVFADSPAAGANAATPVVEQDSPAALPAAVENSVVKVFATSRGPNVYQPWEKQAPQEETASGVVIEGKRILTTFRALRWATDIQVQANLAGDKIPATIELSSVEMDLAVLKLGDETFFDTHPPLERSKGIPSIKDTVFAYGFPVGGTGMSTTKGIISRIEYTQYAFPTYGLRIQIDAALNPGNSGGAAMIGTKMAGLALSHLQGTEKIGYVIPNEELDIFLGNLPAGKYTRKPGFYDSCQPLQNTALRPFLKLEKTDKGMLLHKVDGDDPKYPLQEWDLISKVGDYPLDDQGMIHEGELRLDFRYAVQRCSANGSVRVEIVRQGKHLTVDVPTPLGREMVVPGVAGSYPPYFIYGPIVFSKATQAYSTMIMSNPGLMGGMTWDASQILNRRGDRAAFPGEEIVIVPCPMFSHKLSTGYFPPASHVVESINGVRVRNLRHVVELLRDAQTDYITIRFLDRNKETIVFPRKEALEATEQILSDNGVREQASPELLEVWRSKPPS
ncbi:MAG TPA: trypsin-like peptidase domain-containing protein [Opitutaceae bacterium]